MRVPTYEGLKDEDDPGFIVDEENEMFVVFWGAYDYEIDFDRLKTPEALLEWVAHMGEKNWEDMTPWRISLFIKAVVEKRGWQIYGH